jgi:hypothetical protein
MLRYLKIRQNHALACAAAVALLGLTLFVPATLAQSTFGTILGTSTNEWFSTSAFVCPATLVSARSPAPAVPTSAATAPDRFRLVSSFSRAPFAVASAGEPLFFRECFADDVLERHGAERPLDPEGRTREVLRARWFG